jgi:hypothetical protein
MRRILASIAIGLWWSSSVVAQIASHDPIEAGARYGEARGASQLCPGFAMSKSADALAVAYQGADQKVFQAQAEKIFDAWRKVKNCVRPLDPNPCRIMIELSCRSALSEIGPNGSVRPDLLELRKR